jgi:RNA polymerase sigma factor (sigma-70 family)
MRVLADQAVGRSTRRDAAQAFQSVTETGLKAVFLAERAMLLRLLVARLGNRADAEDALQDIWIKLDQPGVQPVAQPAAYLYRMAANLAADRRIAATRAGARDTAWLDVQPDAQEQPSIERTLLAREQLARLEAALAQMPERMSQALRLYRIENMPQKQIAQRLGMTVSGVEKLLRRAVKEIGAYKLAGEADSGDEYRLSGKGESDRGR